MKAMLLTNHGGPEMMRYGEAPDPVAGPGEVVVDIHAASVNGADPKVRRGNGRYKLSQFPHIMGRDFSGLVSQVGAGVTDFKVGRRRIRRARPGHRRHLCGKARDPCRACRQEARFAQSCRRRGARAHQPHRAHGHRRYRAPQSGSDHSDPGRRRRRRRIRRATRQAPGRHGDHDRERRQPRLCAQPRRRPRDRLQRRGFHQDRSDLRRGVRHRRRQCPRRLLRRT